MKRILVPSASATSAYEAAEYVMQIASILKAEVHVLHVLADDESEEDCSQAYQLFQLACEENDVRTRNVIVRGSVAQEIIRYAETNEINLVLMGASNGVVVEEWLSHEVLGHSTVPVLVMPYQLFDFSIHDSEETEKPWSILGWISGWRK